MYIFFGILAILVVAFFYMSRSSSDIDNKIADQVKEEIRKGKVKELKIYHISDLHYLSDKLTDYGNLFEEKLEEMDSKSIRYVGQIFDCFVQECINTKPDLVIFSGDLTLNGEKISHMDLRDKLMILKKNNIPVIVLPGNHDINNEKAMSFYDNRQEKVDTVDVGEFMDIYGEFGYGDSSKIVSRDRNSLSYLYRLQPGLSILMLDTNTGDNIKHISKASYKWIEKTLLGADQRNEKIISVSHQNILAHNKIFIAGYKIDNSSRLIEMYNRHNVRLNLSGHMHSQHIAEYKNVYDAAVSCLSLYPNQYAVISLDLRDNMYYETRQLDIEQWAQLYSKPDKNLVNFKKYSKEFIKRTTKNQTDKMLEGIDLGEDEKYKMTNFIVDTNVNYFTGRMIEHPELNINSDAYNLCQKYCEKTFLGAYLNSIYTEKPRNHNKLEIR